MENKKGYLRIALKDRNNKTFFVDDREYQDVAEAQRKMHKISNFIKNHSRAEVLEELTTASVYVSREEDLGDEELLEFNMSMKAI